jgi:hypothetical protein
MYMPGNGNYFASFYYYFLLNFRRNFRRKFRRNFRPVPTVLHVKMSDKRFVSCSAIILIYCCCYLFRDSIRNLHVYFKTMFGSSLPPVICRRLMSYLPLLCLFPLSGVQHISTILDQRQVSQLRESIIIKYDVHFVPCNFTEINKR